MEYEEQDIDIDKIKKIAAKSSKRIQKERDKRLEDAIKNNDSYYIRRELENVSTYDLIKMILSKII